MRAAWAIAVSVFVALVSCRDDAALTSRSVEVRTVGALPVAPSQSRAHVELPRHADEPVVIGSEGDRVSVRVVLSSAVHASGRVEADVTVHDDAIDGGDVAHVVLEDGFEDFAFFERRPAREELVYDVDLTRVAGLRRVGQDLELLDVVGVPRLRVMQPWLIDRDQRVVRLDLETEGCEPKKPACRLRVAWGGRDVRYPLIVDPTWQLTTSMDRRHAFASIRFKNGKILSMNGIYQGPSTSGNGPSDKGALFDPTTSTWSLLSSIGTRINGALALLPSGDALSVGGGGSSYADIVPQNGGFAQRQLDAGHTFGEGVAATSLLNGKVLVTGGSGSQSDALLFDEATHMYTTAGTSPAGSMKIGRVGHTATLLQTGTVLIAGGGGVIAELYDPVADTFTTIPNPMVAARSGHTASLLVDGTVLLAGSGATAEIFDPKTSTFTATGATTVDHAYARAVLLDSGNVMLGGGDGPLATVEIYDVAKRVWRTQSPFLSARAKFGLERLPDGAVLAFGGLDRSGFSNSNVEVWRPGAAGSSCLTSDECRSGACEEGICCETPCEPSCQTCVAGTGACVTVVSADDPSSCTGANTCDAKGVCKKKLGQSCASGVECVNGICVDGVCCDRACDGQCEACDVPGQIGACAPAAGAPHGSRPTCTAAGTICGGTCNGLAGASCAFPSALTTCASTCSGADLTASTCDGEGGCVVEAPRPCAGNFACADATSCRTRCSADTDCRAEYRCDSGACLPIALCESHYVTKGTERVDCYPYTCEQSGVCRTECASVSDCVAPTVCGFDGRCIEPPMAPEVGCAASPRHRGGAPAGVGAALVALVVARRRRSR